MTSAQVLEALGGHARVIVRDFEALEVAVDFIGTPALLTTPAPDELELRARERRARRSDPAPLFTDDPILEA